MDMRKKMKTTFEYKTKRLIVRFYKAGDFKEWKRAHSHIESKKNVWDMDPIPLEDVQKLKAHFKSVLEFHKSELKNERGYHFAVFLKRNNNLVATASLMDISRGIFNNAYVGYRILNNYWSMGYGNEILDALTKIAFKELSLHRIEAGIEPNNIRSIGLVKKLGFRKEGRSKKRLFVRDE